jgi:hypothetical protein
VVVRFFVLNAFMRSVVVIAGVLAASLECVQVSAADGTTLSTQIDNLTKALTSEAAKDDTAQASLIALLAQIAKTDCSTDTTKKIDCKFAQIIAFAGQSKPGATTVTAKQQSALWEAVQPLLSIPVADKDTHILAALDFAKALLDAKKTSGITQSDAVVDSVGGVVASAVPAVIASKPADKLSRPKIVAMVQTTAAMHKSLDQLLATLPLDVRTNLLGAINILGAWYGDIRSIRGAGPKGPWAHNNRFCSATRAIRTRCQAKARCYEPSATSDDGAVAELTGSQLCGYEPAPFADSKYKGVVVSYECVALDGETWKAIGSGDPERQDFAHEPLDAQLRTGAIEEIRCQGNSP